MAVPTQPNERWSLDFVHDQLADGRRIRILNIVDDYSRVCVGQLVDLSISGARLARYLNQLKDSRDLPRTLVLDNGPELTSKAMFFWSQETKVRLHFIQPGNHIFFGLLKLFQVIGHETNGDRGTPAVKSSNGKFSGLWDPSNFLTYAGGDITSGYIQPFQVYGKHIYASGMCSAFLPIEG